MITKEQLQQTRKRAYEYLQRAGIVLTESEQANIEVADFGLSELEKTGLELVTYINTERCCGKELVLFPRQTCPEHLHPPVGGQPGKEETFRCRWGEVYLYVAGTETTNRRGVPPAGSDGAYSVWHEIVLKPGEQYTIYPNTFHWFQGGDKGAVVSEFSTQSQDEFDIFTDKRIQRVTKVS